MRIKAFTKSIETCLEQSSLKNCAVVIDAQNYFYDLYQDSGLPFQFGCESDKYAEYLKDHLSMFKKANVKCCFIFKGGDTKGIKKFKNDAKKGEDVNGNNCFRYATPCQDFVHPVFVKTLRKEVLDELEMDYAMCEFEAKTHCIALAQKLKCPIISFDIEFGFSGVPYIPKPTITNDLNTESIQCGIFKLENFMSKYGISKEKLALFIVLTDENIFPELFFQSLFEEERIPYTNMFRRNLVLINWLSRKSVEHIISKALQILSPNDIQKFQEERTKMLDLLGRVETPGKPVKYLLNKKAISFKKNDPCWFEKGVITSKIASCYIDLYYSNILYGSWCIEDLEAEDPLFLSIDIVKYAFNLLTNYQKENMYFNNNKWEIQNVNVGMTDSALVQKPPYEALASPFENGWDGLESLQLFDHFIKEFLSEAGLIYIATLPNDARLLMLTLVYFSRRKTVDTTREVYSILLSYVMLGVVSQKVTAINNEYTSDTAHSGSGNDLVDLRDCNRARYILEPFFKLSRYNLLEIFDRKLIHSFVEFQHCISHMNYLNKLCGQNSFEPTVYSKTYNGTFVYKIFYFIRDESAEKALLTIKEMLTPAPTVLDYFMNLVKVYEQIMIS